MPAIKKILFPVDFSDSCRATAQHVATLAEHLKAQVILLHVADPPLAEKRSQLDAFPGDQFKNLPTHRVCVTGDAAQQIVETVKLYKPDLVAMATHGVGAFRRVLLGSVTAKVLNDVECPVWTAAHLETPKRAEQVQYRRVLVAVDPTARSRSVLDWAAWLAGLYKAELGIVHATAELSGAYYGHGLEQEFAESMAEEARKRIETLQAEAGTAARVFINSGNPAHVVACAAQEFEADLVVLGRHSRSGIAGYLRPNAYAILRESPCPAISI